MFRRKKLVRIHLKSGPTVEGVLVSKWLGNYQLQLPKQLLDDEQTISLEGYAEIPASNVHYYQVLAEKP